MLNKELADKYLVWVSKNYTHLKNKYFKFCQENQFDYDEDIFSETYLKIYDVILKRGIEDSSEKGFDNYTFKSYKNNIMNEQRYSRNKKRDKNINSDTINDLYETWYNDNFNDARVKIINDLFKDFSILYIMMQVESNFDSEHFYLFKVKTLVPDMTFKKLADTTKIKASRRKTIEVMHWVKDNIKKEEIRTVFFQVYGDLI